MNEKTKRLLKNAGSFLGVIALSSAVLWIMSLIAARIGESTEGDALKGRFADVLEADSYDEFSLHEAGEPYSSISAAYKAVSDGKTTGYVVELTAEGYGGEMELTVGVSPDGKKITGMKVRSHSETPDLGGKTAEKPFLSQFSGAQAPFYLGRAALTDGTYFAESDSFSGGYKDNMTLTVENGLITRVFWDGESEIGEKSKRQASIDGEYVMTADGLLWHEQAQLMESRLLEVQSPSKISFGDNGKTDAVAGVSISISPFITLAEKCCAQAGASDEGTAIDGVSGATISSGAVTEAANTAVDFTERFLLGNSEPAAISSGSDLYE